MVLTANSSAQIKATALDAKKTIRCSTMDRMEASIKKDPSLVEKWAAQGQVEYNAYLQRKATERVFGTQSSQIIIPVVFHLVDTTTAQSWITDRDIYRQVEILNEAYGGLKADMYKNVIPSAMYGLLGRMPVTFVLARRTPSGALTTGIERRVTTTPDIISIKSTAAGGLDAWDPTRYLNVWCGTFTGGDDGLLGIATFPFTTTEGPQGIDIAISTLPFVSNVPRSYYPAYAEGATLCHEVGHYFYLWHTFGDDTVCNNLDFRIESGWPLPTDAGPDGDDTPDEKYTDGPTIYASFGNPSENYRDGCTTVPYGEMYGCYMNYFDDRAMFMFSQGMTKRVIDCIDLYRPTLETTNGATPPVPVTDAYLVTVTPYGSPERQEFMVNNTPLTATVRNGGTSTLTSVNLNIALDASGPVSTAFSLNLSPGSDTTLSLGSINATTGSHVLTVYTSAPNHGIDMYTDNDTLQSFFYVAGQNITAPFTESFADTTFPPVGWTIWNPNGNNTWTRSATSGFSAVGAATVQNYEYNGNGQLDELVAPPINMGSFDSSLLSFHVAYQVFDTVDVSTWDGLEVYISGDGGITYQLVYKKSGDQLRTVIPQSNNSFTPLPGHPSNWRLEQIDLTPYIVAGKSMIIKFRNVNAYGNNLYVDDINVSGYALVNRDAFPISISNLSDLLCQGATPAASVSFGTNGTDTLKSLKINYMLDNGAVSTVNWTGALTRGQTSQVLLGALTGLSIGNHILTVFTSNPNGLPDEYPSNDTITESFYVFGTVPIPVTEGFEGTSFTPNTWALSDAQGGFTWERTTTAADSGIASMVIRNFDYATTGTVNKFASSVVTGESSNDSVFVSFDYAYAIGSNPNLPDTLEVQVTPDCNQTYTSVWKKWGTDLATSSNSSGAEFSPLPTEWAHANVYLSPSVGTNNFQLNFVAESNMQNDLYLDNINIYGKVVPPLVKQKGYLIYPSPFTQQLLIRNYEVPTTLQSVSIYNSIGQLVWKKDYDGNAYTEMTVDLGNCAAGIYIVKMQYTNKTIVDKIEKQQ